VPAVRRVARTAILLAALAAVTGSDWALLQCVAWAGMLARNLHSVPTASAAFAWTFDGRHPCCLCKAAAAGSKTERKMEANLEFGRFPVPPARLAAMPAVPRLSHFLPLGLGDGPSVDREPPVPPPRGPAPDPIV
jgi:hypothetical protein